jgi:hypothetical protein
MDLTEGSETSAKLNLTPGNILHPDFEDGPDRGFRNVGKLNLTPGKYPKENILYSIYTAQTTQLVSITNKIDNTRVNSLQWEHNSVI